LEVDERKFLKYPKLLNVPILASHCTNACLEVVEKSLTVEVVPPFLLSELGQRQTKGE
jgi:hypothetical protein